MSFPINSQRKLQLAQQRVEILADRKDDLLLNPDILGIVLEELAVTLEELQVQYEMLIENQEKAEQQRLHYQNLFELAPECYLVTNRQGIIEEANQATTQLLNMHRELLLGKPLIVLVAESDRRKFATEMISLTSRKYWNLTLTPRQSEPIVVSVITNPIYDLTGVLIRLGWSFRDPRVFP